MNGFKNDMDDEKSQKERIHWTFEQKHQKHNQNASLGNANQQQHQTYSLTTQLDHRAE